MDKFRKNLSFAENTLYCMSHCLIGLSEEVSQVKKCIGGMLTLIVS